MAKRERRESLTSTTIGYRCADEPNHNTKENEMKYYIIVRGQSAGATGFWHKYLGTWSATFGVDCATKFRSKKKAQATAAALCKRLPYSHVVEIRNV